MPSRVFISYSHDSVEHLDRVWNLSDRLRQDGVDCRIDQYEESPPEGWPRWCSKQVDEAEFVLIICTEIYRQRYEGKGDPGTGRGVRWEGHVITQDLYEAETGNVKFVPVVFSAIDSAQIPKEVRSATYYNVASEQGYEKLFRRLTNQPERRPSKVAERLKSMSTRDSEQDSPKEASSQLLSMPTMGRKQYFSKSALSRRDQLVITFSLVVVGVGLLVLFGLLAPKLMAADILDKFFYMVAVVWGLVCALVLFGVVKSYAHVTHKSAGLAIEIGGPAAFAALVIVAAFWIVPRNDTFNLTVRPHGPNQPLITSGTVRVEFGNFASTQVVNLNGEADFKGIPHKYRGAKVRILPEVDGYLEKYQELFLAKDAIDLNLTKAPPLEVTLRGRLTPVPSGARAVRVLVEGEDGESLPDRFGRFRTIVHKKIGEMVGINVCASGRSIYNNYVTVSEDEIEIPVHAPDSICSE